jgi:UDP-N-acetylglucosamine acyltransferase
MEGARIGKDCRIFPGAVISAIPQDLKFEGEDSLTEIGDNTTIRECVTINRGTNASGKTKIGKNCLIMATTHIAHDCILGDNSIIVNGVALGGHVIIGEYAIIGGLAAVHQFIHIGDHAMVSGGSLVRKDVPPFTKAGKEPLSYVGINSIGLRRRGFSTEKIREIQNIYRILYQKNYNNTQAVEKIEAEMEATTERDEIILFIRNSQRGIMKGYWGG